RDDRDAGAVHVVSRAGTGELAGRVVATGRLLLPEDGSGTAGIGRMAADASVRGSGHGAAVLDELHRQAALRGATAVELHAQVTARRFYERAGYTAVGEEYLEAGIRHVTMRRVLVEPDAGRVPDGRGSDAGRV
ncbi:MAG: GNAT family N-acetyltransferase, partial [Blastococcus sp.]|nr:GNAT family N-acetyltransferase [Blastococcus sp.]